MKIRVGIIGAAGFIGRNLAMHLSGRSDVSLTCFCRSAREINGIACEQLDLLDPAAVSEKMSRIDIAYYLASETIPASSWNDPLLEVERNLVPFLKFMQAAAGASLKKLVFLSSAGTVYGASTQRISEFSDKRPFAPYGITKLAMEQYLSYFEIRSGIHYDVFRVSNVYGEGQDTTKGLGLINTLIEKILAEKKVTVFGEGNNSRNFIYINDAVELLTLSLRKPFTSSDTYNLSSNDTLSVREIIERIRQVTGEQFEIVRVPARQSDNPYIDLDNSRILGDFGDFRFTPLETGIARTYAHIKNQTIHIHRTP